MYTMVELALHMVSSLGRDAVFDGVHWAVFF